MFTTSSRSRRRTALVSLATGLTVTLSACSAGFDAETVQVYNAPAGTDMRQADVDILGALVVADGSGGGTLVAGLVAMPDTADTLTAVEITDAEGRPLQTTIGGGSVEIPTDVLVQTADTLADTGQPAVTVSGAQLEPGRLVTVAFTFERSGPVSGMVLIVARDGPYAEVPTAPPAEPTGGGNGGGGNGGGGDGGG